MKALIGKGSVEFEVRCQNSVRKGKIGKKIVLNMLRISGLMAILDLQAD